MRKFRAALTIAALCVLALGVRPAVAKAPVAPVRVYLFAGQSNMVGAATTVATLPLFAPALQLPHSRVSFWGPTTDSPSRWVPLRPPTEVWKNIFKAGFGPELSAGRALAELHPGSRIAVVKYAWNATSLYWDWAPGRSHGRYETMIDGTRRAMRALAAKTKAPVRLEGFFWMQGESDADTYAHARSYGARLQRFIAAVRSDLREPKLPVVIAQIDDVRRYHPALLPHSRIVRAEQARVARADPRTFLVSTDGLAHMSASRIHFNTEGTIELGRRFVRRSFGL